MKKMMIALVASCVALPLFGSVVFESDFNNASNKFQTVANTDSASPDNVDPDNGIINFKRSKSQPARGFISIDSHDLSGDDAFEVSWNVETVTSLPNIQYNGWFFGVSGTSGLWNQQIDAIGLNFDNSANGKVALTCILGGTKSLIELGDFTNPTSGFDVQFSVGSDDWVSVTTSGLNENVSTNVYSVAGIYDALASQAFANTSIQSGDGTTAVDVEYGSMSLQTIPEPATLGLIAMTATGIFAVRRLMM